MRVFNTAFTSRSMHLFAACQAEKHAIRPHMYIYILYIYYKSNITFCKYRHFLTQKLFLSFCVFRFQLIQRLFGAEAVNWTMMSGGVDRSPRPAPSCLQKSHLVAPRLWTRWSDAGTIPLWVWILREAPKRHLSHGSVISRLECYY